MSKFNNYFEYVKEEAQVLVEENLDELKEEFTHRPVGFHEFFEEIVHDHVDNDFIYVDLRDSAEILEQSNNVETDSGLWEGQEPKVAIHTQAFFTYRYDLMEAVIAEAKEALTQSWVREAIEGTRQLEGK